MLSASLQIFLIYTKMFVYYVTYYFLHNISLRLLDVEDIYPIRSFMPLVSQASWTSGVNEAMTNQATIELKLWVSW